MSNINLQMQDHQGNILHPETDANLVQYRASNVNDVLVKLEDNIDDLKASKSLEYTGNNIICENTLTSRTSDVVVKGQTYQNVSHVTFDKASDFTTFDSQINKFENGFLVANSDTPAEVYGDAFTTPFKTIKPNTIYTIVLDVLENTLTMGYELSSKGYEGNIPQFVEEYSIPQGFVGRKIFTLTSVTDVNTPIGLRSFYTKWCSGKIKYKYYILEGDWTNKELPESITGIKSVGEKENKISILSHGKNLFNMENLVTKGSATILNRTATSITITTFNDWEGVQIIGCRLKPNTTYRLKFDATHKEFVKGYIRFRKADGDYPVYANAGDTNNFTFTMPENNSFALISIETSIPLENVTISNIQLTEREDNSVYEPHKEDKKEILLPLDGGLKSLPNGTTDTIEQRNDGVYLVQRVGKVVLNGSEDWNIAPGERRENTILFFTEFNAKLTDSNTSRPVITDKFSYFGTPLDGIDVEGAYTAFDGNICISISKSKLTSETTEGLKQWLSQNPTTVYYELATPIETKLDINNLDLEIYKDTTYVTTDNAIQPVLKLKVPSNIGGVLDGNAQNVNKLYRSVDELDSRVSNVDNTRDLDKPISTATQNALNGKANTSHTHTKSQITDFPTKLSQFTNDTGYLTRNDIDTSSNHTHANKSVLDGITSANVSNWNDGARKVAFVGSEDPDTNGWYKVASQTCSSYGNTNITFMVTSTFYSYNFGILQLQIRSDDTNIHCPRFSWLVRDGFDINHFVIVINGMTWTLYAYQPSPRYGRICFEILSMSSIFAKDMAWTLNFKDNYTKESTTPNATVTSSDGATVSYANSSGSSTRATQDSDGKQINTTYVKKGMTWNELEGE